MVQQIVLTLKQQLIREQQVTVYSSPNNCGNQQRCLHFWLLLEDLVEQLFGIVKNVDRHGKTALFLIMTDSCLRIIQVKTKETGRHHRHPADLRSTRRRGGNRVYPAAAAQTQKPAKMGVAARTVCRKLRPSTIIFSDGPNPCRPSEKIDTIRAP